MNLTFRTIRSIICGALLLFVWASSVAAEHYHCAKDTTIVLGLVRECYNPGGDPGAVAGKVAETFIGTPFEEVTKNDSTGLLTLRADAFDDMTFLNTVAAISRLSTSPGHKRINELERELENLSCRRGEEKGFASRMLYLSDWVVDNKARRNILEETETYSDSFRTKSLDKVTHLRGEYAALKDSATYEDMKMVEMGFRTHKVPHLKREQAATGYVDEELRDGDIIVLLTPEASTDAAEIGFLRKRDDGFHLIHPSAEAGKVVEEKETLARYIKRNAKRIYGWRWLRLAK